MEGLFGMDWQEDEGVALLMTEVKQTGVAVEYWFSISLQF
jgi:hypothetical protein